MGYGAKQVFTDVIASGTSTSSGRYLGDRSHSAVFVQSVTFSTNAALTVQTSFDGGTTWLNVNERVNTATVQYQIITIPTSVSGGIVPIFVPGTYVRFLASATVTDGATIKVVCHD